MSNQYLECTVSAIDSKDLTYLLYEDSLDQRLLQSIRKIGLIQPLLLQKMNKNEFRIVNGFKRMSAIRELGITTVPAFITPLEHELQIFKTGIEQNQVQRSFHAMEISGLIQKAEQHFQLDKTEIIRQLFPLLGVGANPQVYKLYAPLISLDPEWQQALRFDTVSLEVAHSMSSESVETRLQVLRWINIMRLNKNQQRDFWQLLTDVSRIENCSVTELSRQKEFESVLQQEKLTPSQKADQIKRQLMQRRYPRFHEVQNNFDRLIKHASLPENVMIRTDPYFESGQITISISATEINNVETALNKLDELLKSRLIHKVLDTI